jgi:hypothetical protein
MHDIYYYIRDRVYVFQEGDIRSRVISNLIGFFIFIHGQFG